MGIFQLLSLFLLKKKQTAEHMLLREMQAWKYIVSKKTVHLRGHIRSDCSAVRQLRNNFYHRIFFFFRKVEIQREICYLDIFWTVAGAEAAEHWGRQCQRVRHAAQHVFHVQHNNTHSCVICDGAVAVPFKCHCINMYQTWSGSNQHRKIHVAVKPERSNPY